MLSVVLGDGPNCNSVSSFNPPAPVGGKMLLITAVPLTADPSNPLLPSEIKKTAASGVATINRRRMADSRGNLERVAKAPRAAGWQVGVMIAHGAAARHVVGRALRNARDPSLALSTRKRRVA